MSRAGSVDITRLPSGYWHASLVIPGVYQADHGSFHDEQEARDWAESMASIFGAALRDTEETDG